MNVLFVCSENRLRSPTAAAVYGELPGIEARSAGTSAGCPNPVTEALIEWCDVVLVMEKTHRNRLMKRFRKALSNKRLAVLHIPDDFEFMEPSLVDLLSQRVPSVLAIAQYSPGH